MSLRVKKILYKIFLGLGIFGISDGLIGSFLGMEEIGIQTVSGKGITTILYIFLVYILGESFATQLLPLILMISSLFVIWFIVAYGLNRSIKS